MGGNSASQRDGSGRCCVLWNVFLLFDDVGGDILASGFEWGGEGEGGEGQGGLTLLRIAFLLLWVGAGRVGGVQGACGMESRLVLKL